MKKSRGGYISADCQSLSILVALSTSWVYNSRCYMAEIHLIHLDLKCNTILSSIVPSFMRTVSIVIVFVEEIEGSSHQSNSDNFSCPVDITIHKNTCWPIPVEFLWPLGLCWPPVVLLTTQSPSFLLCLSLFSRSKIVPASYSCRAAPHQPLCPMANTQD